MPYAPATDSSFLTRRGFVFVLIIALHAGMYYVLNSGLSQHLVDVVLGPIETPHDRRGTGHRRAAAAAATED